MSLQRKSNTLRVLKIRRTEKIRFGPASKRELRADPELPAVPELCL